MHKHPMIKYGDLVSERLALMQRIETIDEQLRQISAQPRMKLAPDGRHLNDNGKLAVDTLLCAGFNDAFIADLVGLDPSTVNRRRSNPHRMRQWTPMKMAINA